MIFETCELAGPLRIEPTRHVDERGFLARTWCREEFAAQGVHVDWVQCNVSFNERRGTLRGMHYQAAPWEEAKLVRCTMGAIYDVIVDLRPESPTFGRWMACELSAENRRMIYIPGRFAHGFQTLEDRSEVFYQMSAPYHPEAARSVRWNDPAFAIDWPLAPSCMSERDRSIPDLQPAAT